MVSENDFMHLYETHENCANGFMSKGLERKYCQVETHCVPK